MNCGCSDRLKLFFDCLEALPTNQYSDLNKLFPGKNGRALRRRVLQDSGFRNLIQVSEQKNINSWVVFSAEAYRIVVGDRSAAKDAPNRICSAIDHYFSDHDKSRFWDSLADLRTTVNYEAHSFRVYLSLIARHKYRKAENGERYFTVMLDRILEEILESP
jgi:hypothetical protein